MGKRLFINLLWEDPWTFFTVAFLVILSVCCHEFMHAWTALRFGDPTAAEEGHLTFNPIRQMGMISILTFCVFGLAWGKVPVNVSRLKGRFAPALVAASGPLTNLLLAQLFVILGVTLYRWCGISDFSGTMLLYGCVLNWILFLLNALPIPGLDGWAVLIHFHPALEQKKSSEWVGGISFMLIVLLMFGFPRLTLLGWIVCGAEAKGLQFLLDVLF